MIREKILYHIDIDYTEPVRDPLWKNIMLSSGLKKILSSGILQKLNKIKQLGPTYYVYPGATHTRLNHSIGVFHVAKIMLRSLLISDSCPSLSQEGVSAFLCAALLHDMGHFPYAHSLKELPLLDHEQLTGHLIMSEPLYSAIKENILIDPAISAAIVDKSIKENITEEIIFFRNILSGVMDPDKLDYLNRDAYFCGVPYGAQDMDFIINSLIPYDNKIAVLENGLPAVEGILFSKYLMYRAVYWHKNVRSATAMVKKALYHGMKDGKIKGDELYNLDDETLFVKYSSGNFPPFLLLEAVANRNLYRTVVEIPFCKDKPSHQNLTQMEKRVEKEKEIAAFLKCENLADSKTTELSIIIDVPEQISFEIDIPVISNGKPIDFSSSASVFSKPVIEGFTETLRKIRLFLPKELLSLIENNKNREDIKAAITTIISN